jgi:shikimate kinase
MSDNVLILTGFMGSGKSSVGKVVAERLGYQFVDLDAEIVTAAGCSIMDFFARNGEHAFRLLESLQLERVLSAGRGGRVLATGGGAVISSHNRKLMRSYGVIVNLKVSLDQVIARLSGCSDRPLLAGDNTVKRAALLLEEREQFYCDSDIKIDTDGKSVEDVAAEILSRFKRFAK